MWRCRCRLLHAAGLLGVLFALVLAVHAEDTATGLGHDVCPDAEMLGPKLITDIWWS